MGVVYKAFDPELGRPIALKLLNTEEGPAGSLRDRLLREAQALARLSHPNVVAVHDVGTFGDNVFIAMEFVEGETLREWLSKKPRSRREILDVFLAAGQGLAAAHRAGLVHRDFKPDNVVVGSAPSSSPQDEATRAAPAGDGRVRVLDFGLARDATSPDRPPGAPLATPLPPREPAGDGSSLNTPLTRVGSVMGTPRYMAPEQHRGEVADARADQFSFCVSLYHALYGQSPFDGRDFEEFKVNVLRGRYREPPAGTRVPRSLRLVLLRGLAVDPGDRHPSMDALLAHLAPSTSERSRWLSLGAVALALGLTISGALGWRARALERAQLCQGGPSRLDGVWDAAAKRRVHDALVATGKPYAADAWSNVEQTLDRYATAWVAMHKESCERTRLRGEQTDAVMALRMACLDRKLQGVSALVNVLAEADSPMVEKAGAAAAGLSSLDECKDASALLSETPLPVDPGLRQRIAATRAELSRADALRLAGKVSGAVALAERGVAEARETGNEVILAEALLQEGRARAYSEPGRAAQLFTEAFWPAFSNRIDRTAVAAATGVVRGYALTLHADEAELWDKLAQASLQRMGGDDELESDLWSARSIRALEMRRFEDELQAAARAARLSERRLGLDDLRTIAKQENELNAISDAARPFESWKRRGPLLEREERLLGSKHPMVAEALMDLGDDEVAIGHLAEARAHLARAEALVRELSSTRSLNWTTLRSYEVRLAEAEGRTSDEGAIAREVLATFDSIGRGDSDLAIFLRIELALGDAQQGRGAEAIATLEALMRDAEKSHGKGYSLTLFHSALAKVYLKKSELVPAYEEERKAVASAIDDSGEGSCPVAEERVVLAQVLVAQGHPAEALTLVDAEEPALVLAEGDRGPSVALARRVRGDALAALGRFDEACSALRSSLAIQESDGLDPEEREATRAALAAALAKGGRAP